MSTLPTSTTPTTSTAPATPATYKDALAQGYRPGPRKYQRGYVSRRTDVDAAPVHIAGGNRRGQLYVLLPSYDATAYCFRQYLIK